MNRLIAKTTLVLIGWLLLGNNSPAETPQWLSVVSDSANLSKTFAIKRPVSAATLQCANVSAGIIVSLDGDVLAKREPYDPIAQLDVTSQLRSGDHELSIECHAVAGPPAICVWLEVFYPDGSSESIVSDASWSCDGQPAETLGQVSDKLLIPRDRRVNVVATDNYDQWKQARSPDSIASNPAKFSIASGFEIELVRVAQPDEDSWVSMAFDPNGRVLIAKEKAGILRLTLGERGSSVTQSELINDTLKECRGLVFVGETLFANANNDKGLYKLPSKGDGFGASELVYASSGGVGHGRNDLALGPDGMIYAIHGDSVDLPKSDKCVDYTSPLREANTGTNTREGHLLRIDPNTGAVELLAAGLRNPFGIDFNSEGEAFTYDADAEYDMGAPWYRPTRVSNLVVGGDYGWRGVTKSWPPYYPDRVDFARPGLDIGKGSPTAVKFGTRSSFPKPYRDALFILDWTYGRIIAVHMVPRGASYLMMGETFLKGRPLNVTDLDFAPDGSMYFVTGGRKTQSALYRVRYVGAEKAVERPTDFQAERDAFAKQSRELRRRLESALVNSDAAAIELATKELANDDPWIQHAARNVLERQPMAATQEAHQLTTAAKLKFALGVTRDSKRKDLLKAFQLLERERETLRSGSRSEKLVILQCYKNLVDSPIGDELLSSQLLSDVVEPLYPDDSYDVNRLIGELLVQTNSPHLVPKTMKLLRSSSDQHERLQYLFLLRNVTTGWSVETRREYFSSLASVADIVGGDGMPTFQKKIREEAVATLTDHERKVLGTLIEPSTVQQTVEAPKDRKFVRQWRVSDFSLQGDQSSSRERGAKVFSEALCINCHRFENRGTFVGPDLTSVGRRFSRKDILASILRPSDVISEKYQSVQIVTSDGKTYTGQIALGGDYRSTKLRLATDPNQPLKTIEIDKSDIETKRPSPVSWMPNGLLDTFTASEIESLLDYLQK